MDQKDKENKDVILLLMDSVLCMAEALNLKGVIKQKDFSYANDLVEAVDVLYLLNTYDLSDFQKELLEKEEPMDFEEAYLSLMIRLKSLAEYCPEGTFCTRF